MSGGRLALGTFVRDFAAALRAVDSQKPVALNQRSKAPFKPGIGPHSEAATIALIMQELQDKSPASYGNYVLGVPYPTTPRLRCDLCLGTPPIYDWAMEVKLLRFLGDNGQANDNILMHILSPYPAHRSALTDCTKLVDSGFNNPKATLIYGFESAEWPLKPAIDAFEALAQRHVHLGSRITVEFDGLVHPVHARGAVYAWEISPLA